MPPKKKKNNAPRNAFYFFMLEYKRRREAEGHVFPGGMKDVASAADFAWKGLDPKSKGHYENLAEREKISGSRGVRYNTQGQTYEEVEREKQELEAKKELMLRTIKRDVECRGREGLKGCRFYFIHLNHYGAMEDHRFIPCEVAVLAYSIEQGFEPQRIYDTLIKNMELPNGYTYKAKSQMEATHKCPLPPYARGTSDYQQIYDNILTLMHSHGDLEDGRPPPMYTLTQFMPEAVDFISKGNRFLPPENHFTRIYPLEELFYQMKNFGLKPVGERLFFNGIEDRGFPFLALAAEILKGDGYDYAPGLACQFHEDEDVRQHCSRSYVIRWSYLFSDHLCANLDVPIVPVRHTPRGAALNAVTITTQIQQMSKMTLANGTGTIPKVLANGTGAIPKRVTVESPKESCGRGKPLDGHTLPKRPQSSTGIDSWTTVGSTSRCNSRTSMTSEKPLTIIDHSKFQVDECDYDPPPPAPICHEAAPLRPPKNLGKSRSSLLENAVRAQNEADSVQNEPLGGVGRGRGMLKFP